MLLGQRITESSRSLEDRYLCSLMNSSGLEELKDYLERETAIDLTRVVDDQGYTLAHLATYHNSLQTLKLLCAHVSLSVNQQLGTGSSRA